MAKKKPSKTSKRVLGTKPSQIRRAERRKALQPVKAETTV